MDNSTTYIALLRGINVGGHRPLKMTRLQEMFTSMGFKDVSTYIQSGNVIFDAPKEHHEMLGKSIKQQIFKNFGHDVPVIIRSPDEMEKALQDYPFEEIGGWKGYISFLEKEPEVKQKKMLEAQSSGIEKFKVLNREFYSLIDKQTEKKSLFSNNFIEKQLDMFATTRNLRTVQKILEIAIDNK